MVTKGVDVTAVAVALRAAVVVHAAVAHGLLRSAVPWRKLPLLGTGGRTRGSWLIIRVN